MAQGFGAGKVILLGEHAVVYGQPALAAGLSRGVSASVSPGAPAGGGRLEAPAWSLSARAGDGSKVGTALAAIFARLGGSDLDVALEPDLPARAGLGSSAATAVAVARAVAAARGLPEAAVHAAAEAAEVVFHGTPSGIDLAAAASGQVGCFRRGEGWRPVAVLQAIDLCIGLSGRPRDTGAQVDAVRRLSERTRTVATVLGAMGELTIAGEETLARGDVDELGRLLDVGHGLLCALRVSSPELDTLVHLARAAGAIGAKLTGAGGGGAVIALAPGHERDVLARWRAAGFEGFVATIGAGTGTRAGTERETVGEDGRKTRAEGRA